MRARSQLLLSHEELAGLGEEEAKQRLLYIVCELFSFSVFVAVSSICASVNTSICEHFPFFVLVVVGSIIYVQVWDGHLYLWAFFLFWVSNCKLYCGSVGISICEHFSSSLLVIVSSGHLYWWASFLFFVSSCEFWASLFVSIFPLLC